MTAHNELREVVARAIADATEQATDEYRVADAAIAAMQAHLVRTPAESDVLRAALQQSVVAVNDLLNIYADDMCSESDVQESRQRILRNGGTLHYIACVQQSNRAALAATEPKEVM